MSFFEDLGHPYYQQFATLWGKADCKEANIALSRLQEEIAGYNELEDYCVDIIVEHGIRTGDLDD